MKQTDIEDIKKLIKELTPKAKDYFEKKDKRKDTGFNVFYLLSDYYYRETFHGDIICALLSPEEKHREGNLYADIFIDMIIKFFDKKNKQHVNKENYESITVKREVGVRDGDNLGRIDFLIEGSDKHCIVVENKLNDAGDTDHQLPKYNNSLTSNGYKIDAFVYIPLSPEKEPDKSDWKEEKLIIEDKLAIIPAYKIGEINLIEHWLTPSMEKATNEDAKFIIRQYITLLNNLTIDIMNNEPIVDLLVKKENIDATLAIMDNQYGISERVITDFINKLSKKVEEEKIGRLTNENNEKIEIKLDDEWIYCISYYPYNSKYYRYVKNLKNKEISIDKFWNNEGEGPLGWEYYEEKKGWCTWYNNPETLRAMYNGEFASFIIKELKEIRKIAEIKP